MSCITPRSKPDRRTLHNRGTASLRSTVKKIRVVELFAGVGGFRLGLEAANTKEVVFEIIWSNQWEPGATTQYSSEIYVQRFGAKSHSCEDIQEVIAKDFRKIPDHDLLVGGFPCQDYSVAKPAHQAKGIYGTKGVLWWAMYAILKKKGKNAPKFVLLENVDRLLKSPAVQRGRDFAVMLGSLANLGYAVEWRVINAAEYGFPQRRRRVFIMGYKKGTKPYMRLKKDVKKWIYQDGVIARSFPVQKDSSPLIEFRIDGGLKEVSEKFSSTSPSKSPFDVSGVMIERKVYTAKATPHYTGKITTLNDILIHDERTIPEAFFIKDSDRKRWEYVKGGKKEERISKDGFTYTYSEGPVAFPDPLDKPSRTIITAEGGSAPSRFKHVIETRSGRLRRLTPLELERLNMFPDDHTKLMSRGKITPDVTRAFMMGNALVVGVIQRLGKSLTTFI